MIFADDIKVDEKYIREGLFLSTAWNKYCRYCLEKQQRLQYVFAASALCKKRSDYTGDTVHRRMKGIFDLMECIVECVTDIVMVGQYFDVCPYTHNAGRDTADLQCLKR